MESSVYMWNPLTRDFKNLSAVWTYDHFDAQDIKYLAFLSGAPVQTIPYMWDSDPLDHFVREEGIPTWAETAKRVEGMLPPSAPQTLSWCARIVESNFSNTSHCVLPLNIVSEIRKQGGTVRFTAHNAEATGKHPFFLTNVAKNLLLPDLSGNVVGRVRLPDLRKDKTVFIAHQRFRPLKSYMLDALYLGIPMVHNCEMLRPFGAPYYYELNQIQDAVGAWKRLEADYEASKGFFDVRVADARRAALLGRFWPGSVAKKIAEMSSAPLPARLPAPSLAVSLPVASLQTKVLRIAFASMWEDFQPQDNFFTYLLSWVGSLNGYTVVVDEAAPHVVFFGPFSNGGEARWPGVPKVYFTGENAPPHTGADTFLNLGFQYETNSAYIRLPLWVLEVNWFGGDVEKMVNPRPVSLAAATTVPPASSRSKFCAFVATNPSNNNRNLAFHVLNKWKPVDAGGRLFCNLSGGPIPAGRGGGGGELAKVDFYKDYKFALTFENSSAPGYTTEKLFHAKVAGAVPIYWGDPFVDRDFDPKGFVNANQVKTPDELVALVKKMDDDTDAWTAAASVPAISEFKVRWCQNTMAAVATAIFAKAVGATVTVPQDAWASAGGFKPSGAAPGGFKPPAAPRQQQQQQQRIFVTAANAKYVEAAVNAVASLRALDAATERIVYVWPDVTSEMCNALQQYGATEIRVLPTTVAAATPWADFWEPQHFAWKLWVLQDAQQRVAKGAAAAVFYCDAGAVFAGNPAPIWQTIVAQGVLLLDDDEQKNERWCHPTFCKNLRVTADELAGQQIWAGGIGFRADNAAFAAVLRDALSAAATRDTIVGEKWKPYSATCLGHRHDQSILSILTHRAKLPRAPLRTFYCDTSMRAAQQRSIPLYVHRGNYRDIQPVAPCIDEAYVINLKRRADRLDTFKAAHPSLEKVAYVMPAVDGKALTLTPTVHQCFRNNDFHWKKAVMGCALSHLSLWEKCAKDTKASSYLILEDDVKFEDRKAALGSWRCTHCKRKCKVTRSLNSEGTKISL